MKLLILMASATATLITTAAAQHPPHEDRERPQFPQPRPSRTETAPGNPLSQIIRTESCIYQKYIELLPPNSEQFVQHPVERDTW
jgi:hypothetical protein